MLRIALRMPSIRKENLGIGSHWHNKLVSLKIHVMHDFQPCRRFVFREWSVVKRRGVRHVAIVTIGATPKQTHETSSRPREKKKKPETELKIADETPKKWIDISLKVIQWYAGYHPLPLSLAAPIAPFWIIKQYWWLPTITAFQIKVNLSAFSRQLGG